MKVLLVNGSLHEKGCTYTALAEVEKALRENGMKRTGLFAHYSFSPDEFDVYEDYEKIPGSALPKPDPAPRAEEREARSTSFSDIAESRDPMGILYMV